MSAALRSFETQWRARAPDALQPIREEAMRRFLKLGLPSLRDETWRYTDLRSIAAQSFAPGSCAPDVARADGIALDQRVAPEAGELQSLIDAGQHAITLTMVNGCPLLDADIPTINSIEINNISELLNRDSKSLERFFEPASDADQRRWTLLNTALFVDGLYLKITAAVATPIVIVHLSTGESAQAAHPRVIIDAAPGSRA